jgi:putative nucleotidyltransferase with HDIG domain
MITTISKHVSWPEWIESGDWSALKTAVPMLPASVGHVMSLALDPDVSVAQLTHVISRDQVLATRVLRLANSAHCGPLEEITSINQATIRIGTAAVRNVVLAVCLSSRLAESRVYGSRGRELLEHSIGTACMSRVLAVPARVDADEAFLCGLLHDIGKLLLLKLVKDFAKAGGPPPSDTEIAAVIDSRHAEMGAYLLRAWQLPAIMVETTQYHHAPDSSPDLHRHVIVTAMANRLSHRYGFGCPAQVDDEILAVPEAKSLGLSSAWLADMDAAAPGLFDTARDIIG